MILFKDKLKNILISWHKVKNMKHNWENNLVNRKTSKRKGK